MSNIAEPILERCVKACNKVSGLVPKYALSITKSRYAFYHQQATLDRLKIHQALVDLANQYAWIEIEFEGRGFDEIPILKKVIISDSKALLDHLDIPVKCSQVDEACFQFDAILAASPAWIQDLFKCYSEYWKQNKPFNGFSWSQFEGLGIGVKFATWAESYDDLKTDFRTASVRALGDSKCLERNISTVAKLLRLKYDSYLELSNEEVIANWGITRFAPLIRISGCSSICFSSGELDTTFADPYLAIPLDNIMSIKLNSEPAYILFIENLASFERYARSINDGGLIIYTGGFPPNHWIRVVNTLKHQLSDICEVYHWGDIDVGGYKILSYLERSLAMNITPYRMLGNEGSEKERIILLDDLINSLNCEGSKISKFKEKIINLKTLNHEQYWVEQESLDPISPLDI